MSLDWLAIVAKNHKGYVNLVRSWGEVEFAEDIVQEMYLKLLQYTTADKIIKDGKANQSYIWFTLRTMFADFQKNKKRIEKVRIGEDFDIEDENTDYTYFEALENLLGKIQEEKDSWHWYDKMLFNLYMENKDASHNRNGKGLSMRQLSKETNISLISIFQTIKNCKERMNDNVLEDYIDFLNSDYEWL